MVDRLETQIIGNGPSGIGIPLKALSQGGFSYEALLEKGLALIGPERNLGSGKLSYSIRSNSAASDFLETVPAAVLDQLEGKSNLLTEIRKTGGDIICLKTIARFEAEVGRALSGILKSSQNSNSPIIDAQASSLRINKDGEVVSYDSDGEPIVVSKNVILSIGAEQEPLNLGENDHKRVFSDDFLRLSDEEIRERAEGKNIVVIGGAHSAFSCIDNIRAAGVLDPITLCHRNGFKLYYSSEAAAENASYAYKQEDVDAGKVHRFEGVRGDAKDRYEKIESGEDEDSRFLGYGGEVEEISEVLDAADVIIQATGYKPKTIPIFNVNGGRVPQDPVNTNESFSPLLIGNGRIFYNGIAITPRDGVNLFQGEFSQKILSQIT